MAISYISLCITAAQSCSEIYVPVDKIHHHSYLIIIQQHAVVRACDS